LDVREVIFREKNDKENEFRGGENPVTRNFLLAGI
jgi:hypothetical protein